MKGKKKKKRENKTDNNKSKDQLSSVTVTEEPKQQTESIEV